MAWHTQQDDPRSDRPPETPYAIAWAALLLSLVACAMSGYVLLKNVDLSKMGGKFKENLKLIESETQKVMNKSGGKDAPDAAEESGSPSAAHKLKDEQVGAGQDAVKWDKLQDRVGDIEQMAKEGDSRAGTYMESLKRDLATLRDYTTEKGSATLDKMMIGLQEAREKLAESGAGAAEKLKEMKKDLEPQVRSAIERAKSYTTNGDAKEAESSAEPEQPAPEGADK